jgi:hypothetical protein
MGLKRDDVGQLDASFGADALNDVLQLFGNALGSAEFYQKVYVAGRRRLSTSTSEEKAEQRHSR